MVNRDVEKFVEVLTVGTVLQYIMACMMHDSSKRHSIEKVLIENKKNSVVGLETDSETEN